MNAVKSVIHIESIHNLSMQFPSSLMSDFMATVSLSNGVLMPRLALGTFKSRGEEVKAAVKWAIETGYTHIDTASIYKNEEQIGEAIMEMDVSRSSLFITSKLSPFEQGYDKALEACERSLSRLKTSYLDLYLIHWPGTAKLDINSEKNIENRHETWKALEKLYSEGKCRAIGVSNFSETHLSQLIKTSEIYPMINQVELHPKLIQNSLRSKCKELKIQVQAYSPLGCGNLLNDLAVEKISKKYQKTSAQVLLRWSIQNTLAVVVKSITRERIIENSKIFDFFLNEEDMDALNNLDDDCHYCWNSHDVV